MHTGEEKSLEALRKLLLLHEDEKKLKRLESELADLKKQMADKQYLISTLEPIFVILLERNITTSRDMVARTLSPVMSESIKHKIISAPGEMARALAPVMGESIKQQIISSPDEVARALAPVMGAAISHQIKEAKDEVAEALYPVIGKTVRKAVTEAMKNLVNAVNQKIDQALRKGLFAKLFHAKITGVSRGELVLKDALPFQIQEIFLIHQHNGLLIAHVSDKKANTTVDQDLISGMLTAIQDFVTEAFEAENKQDLDVIQYGDSKIILEFGQYSYLAIVVSGIEPANFHDQLHNLDFEIHNRYKVALRQFDGDMTELGDITRYLEDFLKIYSPAKAIEPAPQKSRPYFLYLLLIILFLTLTTLAIFKLPGYTTNRKIRNIAKTKIEENIDMTQQNVHYSVSDEVLTVFGNVSSYQLKKKIDSLMHSIAEIKQVNNQLDVLVVTATPEAISAHINEKIRNEMPLQQARPQFLIEGDHVIIEGEVENVTIKRNFGYLVSEVPGVRFVTNNLTVKINEKEIADFRELLKKSTIYFDANADSVSSDQFKLLDAILEYSRRFNVGKLVIKGYSDNSSNPDYNLDLSRQRADVIAAYFNSNHYPPGRIIIEYYGENFPVASNVTADGRAANRRVEFEFMEAR